jgi:arginyl-tRNA synthetase
MALQKIASLGLRYGETQRLKGKTILVEYSSPNIAKPFHVGHLRSTVIGEFLSNLFESHGANVIRMNYLGDWGKQFGLLAVGYRQMGSEQKLNDDPLGHLYQVYVLINILARQNKTIHAQARKFVRQMEKGDDAALALWQRLRTLSLERYQCVYRDLGVQFDVIDGEAAQHCRALRVLDVLSAQNMLVEDEERGGKIVALGGTLGNALLQKRDGTTIYLTRDVAAAFARYETYHFDAMYYVVSNQQKRHFQQLFALLRAMHAPFAERCHHIDYGLVQGMSTRQGSAVFLTEVLAKAKRTMFQKMQDNKRGHTDKTNQQAVAHTIGLSCVVVQDLAAKRSRGYKFDWNRMLHYKGNTGVNLQYTHARLCSLERRNDKVPLGDPTDMSLLQEPEAKTLIACLEKYPSVLVKSLNLLESYVVCEYLFTLSKTVARAINALWVHGQPTDVQSARKRMYVSARMVMGHGLYILGISPLETM